MISHVIPDIVWLAGNVAFASILLSLVGLLASRLFAGFKPSSGHLGLKAICLLLLAMPLMHLASQASGVAWWEFESSFFESATLGEMTANATPDSTATLFQFNTFLNVCEAAILIWLAGAAAVACRSVAEVINLRQWIRMTKQCDDDATLELVARAAKLVGTRVPEVRVTSAAVCPLVVGFLKPKLVLSVEFPIQASPGTLAILVHECEHIRRRDNVWNLLGRLGVVVYWWNPALRRLIRVMDRMCERACDDRAIETTGALREYAFALVDIARIQTGKQVELMCQSLLGGRSDLPSRIARLRDGSSEVQSRSPWVLVSLMTLLAIPLSIPIGLPTIRESLNFADVVRSTSDDDMVYLSLDASDSNAAETLSHVLHHQQNAGNQLIVDLRDTPGPNRANAGTQVRVDESVGQMVPGAMASPVSVVMIVSDERGLSEQIRELIVSRGNGVQILNTNTTSLIGGAHPMFDQTSSIDPYLSWAVRILKHA